MFSLAFLRIYRRAGDDSLDELVLGWESPVDGEEKIWSCVVTVFWPEASAFLCRRRSYDGGGGGARRFIGFFR